jgi:hypothetical protein
MIGLQSYTRGAPWRQLEQWRRGWRVRSQSEQRAVESEREHRVSRLQVSEIVLGHARHANTYTLRRRMFAKFKLGGTHDHHRAGRA